MEIKCFEKSAKIYKALSDVNRLKIINILSSEELCACKILPKFNFTQPTLSHHMKILIDSGLVIASKKGTLNCYKLNMEVIKGLEEFNHNLFHK